MCAKQEVKVHFVHLGVCVRVFHRQGNLTGILWACEESIVQDSVEDPREDFAVGAVFKG